MIEQNASLNLKLICGYLSHLSIYFYSQFFLLPSQTHEKLFSADVLIMLCFVCHFLTKVLKEKKPVSLKLFFTYNKEKNQQKKKTLPNQPHVRWMDLLFLEVSLETWMYVELLQASMRSGN